MTWTRHKDMEGGAVKRWLHNPEVGVISVVTGNDDYKLKSIDGEIRYVFNDRCFSIPCTLRVVAKMPDSEIIKVAERSHKEIIALIVE